MKINDNIASKMKKYSFHIELAKVKDIDEIITLLNEVSFHLISKGIYQWDYPWKQGMIEEDILKQHVYVVRLDEKIIGTYSMRDLKEYVVPLDKLTIYGYRIAVKPNMQRKNIGNEICNKMKKDAKLSKKQLFLDCWSKNDKLKFFYLAQGFVFCGNVQEQNYMISVFQYN